MFEDELFEESLELEDELLPEVEEEDELQEFMVVEDEEFEDDDIEGAVDPKTGDCEWVDYVGDGAYPMSMWRKYRG